MHDCNVSGDETDASDHANQLSIFQQSIEQHLVERRDPFTTFEMESTWSHQIGALIKRRSEGSSAVLIPSVQKFLVKSAQAPRIVAGKAPTTAQCREPNRSELPVAES